MSVCPVQNVSQNIVLVTEARFYSTRTRPHFKLMGVHAEHEGDFPDKSFPEDLLYSTGGNSHNILYLSYWKNHGLSYFSCLSYNIGFI
jgi:hypothetical protein